jgi:3',5'-cyclic AMP phosphodiesterase CpdA
LPLLSLRGKRLSGYLSWRRRRRFVHRLEVLERLTAAVHAEDPVQILVTGDLVHVGLPEEIDAAGRWLETLGSPERVMLVPGNHDLYARDSWPAVASAWQPYLPSAGHPVAGPGTFPLRRDLRVGAGRLRLIGLSSAMPSPLFMAYGRLGEEQCGRLEALLAEADGFRLLLVHHPPLPAMTHWRKGLLDAARLERLLVRHGAELIVHGHVHRNVCRLGPGGMRIYGTASASSGSDRSLASYRSFEVTCADGEWRVNMRLVTLGPDDDGQVTARESWSLALRPAARAPAGAP